MTGVHPTIGCLVFIDKIPSTQAREQVLESLHSLIPKDSWQQFDMRPLYGWGRVGATCLQAIMHTYELQNLNLVILDFDEDEVVHLSRRTGLTITELLAPYVVAMETIVDSKAVGIGFELSPPSTIDDQNLKNAGVALFFVRGKDNEAWIRKELLPMVGHYL